MPAHGDQAWNFRLMAEGCDIGAPSSLLLAPNVKTSRCPGECYILGTFHGPSFQLFSGWMEESERDVSYSFL